MATVMNVTSGIIVKTMIVTVTSVITLTVMINVTSVTTVITVVTGKCHNSDKCQSCNQCHKCYFFCNCDVHQADILVAILIPVTTMITVQTYITVTIEMSYDHHFCNNCHNCVNCHICDNCHNSNYHHNVDICHNCENCLNVIADTLPSWTCVIRFWQFLVSTGKVVLSLYFREVIANQLCLMTLPARKHCSDINEDLWHKSRNLQTPNAQCDEFMRNILTTFDKVLLTNLAMCVPIIWWLGVRILASLPSHGMVSWRVGWLLVNRGFSSTLSTFFQHLARADLAVGGWVVVVVVEEGVWSSSGQDSQSSANASGTPVGI